MYLSTQILTYMGNKRKLIKSIEKIILIVREKLGKDLLQIGDGFAGSGIVSRLCKQYSEKIWANDIASYSHTLNMCYLSNPNQSERNKISQYIDKANQYALAKTPPAPHFIRKYWAPHQNITKKGERTYFSPENARRIDRYRHYILSIPEKWRPYLLAPLLIECSIHNNTNGNFSAYHTKDGIGNYGGKKGIDLKRILKPISIQMPVFSPQYSQISVTQMDTNKWTSHIPELDLVYYDPPYNKHPYIIYYFLLNIINDWDIHMEIPDTYRGQPKNWTRSLYNSSSKAQKTFENLIESTKAKFILLSYNSGGIIPLSDIQKILEKKGKVEKIPIDHPTYNRMKGIANYKRQKKNATIQEFFWLVDCR